MKRASRSGTEGVLSLLSARKLQSWMGIQVEKVVLRVFRFATCVVRLSDLANFAYVTLPTILSIDSTRISVAANCA